MHKYFPDWYREVSLELDQQELDLRWKAIESIAAKLTKEQCFNLVHQLFMLPIPDNNYLEQFRTAFRDTDSAFPMRGNDRELPILAGATIATVLGVEGPTATCLALSTVCVAFGEYDINPPVTDIVTEAMDYLENLSIKTTKVDEIKSQDLPTLNIQSHLKTIKELIDANNRDIMLSVSPMYEMLRNINTFCRKNMECIRGLTEIMNHDMTNLHEELDILWWIYNQTSKDTDSRFDSYEKIEEICLLAGKELSNLVKSNVGVFAADMFIRKIISSGRNQIPKQVKLSDIINMAPKQWRERLVSDIVNILPPFICPIHLAVKLSVSANGNKSWSSFFKKATRLSPNLKKSPLDFSLQFYRESLFLKLL